MKTRILTVVLAFSTIVAMGQRREIRKAGNAIDDGDYQEAKELLRQAEPELSDAREKHQADYYLYKGYAFLGDGQNVSISDLMTASEAFEHARELGHEEAEAGIAAVGNALVSGAIADQEAGNFSEASQKLVTAYELNKQDTIYLYYAASNAVNAGDYDTALEYYKQLKEMDFDGVQTEYFATNKETGEEEAMASKEQMDLLIKTGNYVDPKERTSESKKGEIARNIALIYIERGEDEKAIDAMEDAKAENPGDPVLLQAEADMYYRMEDMEKYREVMEEVVEGDPENPTLYYNLGVSTAQLGETERALEYYEKALELDPEMTNASLNSAHLILSKEEEVVEEMNSLGTSAADNERYDELMEERREIYRSALPYLERVLENNPENLDAARTMMNIFYQLNQPEDAERMKEKVAEIEANQ